MVDIGLPDDLARGALLLVAGDAPDQLAHLAGVLQGMGHRVTVAGSATTALRRAAVAPQPALILLDATAPGTGARELVTGLQRDSATRDIPVIFLIAATAGEEERAFGDGATDCVSQPVRPAVLRARVRSQLLARMALDALRARAATRAGSADGPARPASPAAPVQAGDDAMPFADALEIITAGRGRQFDPAVTRAFLAAFDEFVDTAGRSTEPGR